MSVGVVNKQTGDRIPTAGMPAIDDALDLTSVNPVQNAIITAALANKQDKTDNSLQTTAKTIVGAINEHESDIDSLKSGFTALDNEVNGSSTTYSYADVITVEDAVPANLAGCMVKIEPVQSGTGTPSPDNVRPISGHTEAVVTRCGNNLIENNTFSGVGTFIQSTVFPVIGDYVHRNVTFSGSGAFTFKLFGIKNGVETVIDEAGYGVSFDDIRNNVSQYDYIRVSGYSNDASNRLSNIMVAFTDTDTALPYEPYAGQQYTIALGDTIYGGTVDFETGVMTVDRAIVDLGTLDFTYDESQRFTVAISDMRSASIRKAHFVTSCYLVIDDGRPYSQVPDFCAYAGWDGTSMMLSIHDSRYSDAATYKTAITGQTICYELATPTTIQLTPQQIQLLKGTNTLTASTGQISVTVNGVSGAIGAVQSEVNEIADKVAPIPIIRKGEVNFTDLAVDAVFSSDIAFDTPMPSNTYTVTASASGTTVALCNVGNRTVNGFTVYVRNIGTASIGGAVMWQVMG